MLCGIVLYASAAHVMTQPVAEIEGAAERVVENFRRLIALHDGAARTRTAAAALAGCMLFCSNRTLTAQLVDTLTRATAGEREQRISRLLELFNTHTDWWDSDRIALLGVVNQTRLRLPAGHPLSSKLAAAAVYEEIDATQTLLAAAPPAHAPLFRPPYGARNDLVLAEVAERGLRSVLWNIDSRDWADPIPQSIAQRVIDEAEREGRGIILFHDIHGRSVQALPLAIEGLLKRGFRFARWEAGVLTTEGAPLAAK